MYRNIVSGFKSSLQNLKNNSNNNYYYRKILKDIIFTKRHCSHSTIPEAKIQNRSDIPVEDIRNFSIIAHVDHGKSTLADRLLEHTGAIKKGSEQHQILDKLQVERERGITVKAQSVSLFYTYKDKTYMLNLIDTPGHVDFSNEVSRSLSACQGVILLVDANDGVQAQTVANFYLAFGKDLVIIPVINKIDLKNANPERVCNQLQTLFDIEPSEVLKISAKLGIGIDSVLEAIIERIPQPPVDRSAPFRALMFDSWYDKYRGALCLVYVKDGCISRSDKATFYHTKKTYDIKSLSLLRPEEESVPKLMAGQIGLIGCNMKTSKEALIGDTILSCTSAQNAGAIIESSIPLEGFELPRPMVFAGVYPCDQSQHVNLRSAIEKLALNDPAVTVDIDSSPALGQGWRLGFLGLLHLEVFGQRLQQEYGADSILTAPSVTYKIKYKPTQQNLKLGRDVVYINNPTLFPDPVQIEECFEPMVVGTIITPDKYLGTVMSLCMDRRAVQRNATNIDSDRVMLQYDMPMCEIIVDFHDTLKTVSSGYASFDYEHAGYQSSQLVKLAILLNGNSIEELSTIVHISKARQVAKRYVYKLKEMIPRQMVHVAVQAVVNGKILAREDIKAFRKDVTAKLYGGDVTRKMKLLAQQAAGKKKMRTIANISVPKETFINILKK